MSSPDTLQDEAATASDPFTCNNCNGAGSFAGDDDQNERDEAERTCHACNGTGVPNATDEEVSAALAGEVPGKGGTA